MKKLIMMLAFTAFFISCDSENNLTELEHQTDNAAIRVASNVSSGLSELRAMAFRDMNLGRVVHYNPDEGVVFYPRGENRSTTKIIIPPHSLWFKGREVSGDIRIDYVEIFTKEKMVVLNTPTMGRILGTNDRGLLVTGGEFYMNITFGEGQVVEIEEPVVVSIETNNSDAEPENMVLWNGTRDDNDNLTWDQNEGEDMTFDNGAAEFPGGVNYNVEIRNSSNFGWCNIDKFFEFSGDPTTMKVRVPNGFDESNSTVYMAVRGERNMLAQLDVFDPSSNVFSEHTGIVPEGLSVYFIFVGEQNGQYVYFIESVVLGQDLLYDYSGVSLTVASSYQQLENAILQLP